MKLKKIFVALFNKPLAVVLVSTLLSYPIGYIFKEFLDYPITALLCILNIVISIMAFKNINLMYFLIGDNIATKNNKEYYRIVTSGFIHGDLMHLIFNIIAIVLIGFPLERNLIYMYGPIGSVIIAGLFMLGVYLGGYLTLHTKFGKLNPLHLGSSSGVLALVSFLVLYSPTATLIIFGLIPVNAVIFLGSFALLTLIAMYKPMKYFDMVLTFSKSKVNHAGHMGGFVGGLLVYILFQIARSII